MELKHQDIWLPKLLSRFLHHNYLNISRNVYVWVTAELEPTATVTTARIVITAS